MGATIGEVIDALEKLDPEQEIRYSFCNFVPTELISWRGDYHEAAIGFVNYHDNCGLRKVKDLLENLRSSINLKTFRDYKGGLYIYTRDTPLHVDNYGTSTNTVVKSVRDRGIFAHINTKYEEY